jgi:hypothetical protein
MYLRCKALIAVCTAALLMAVAVSSASGAALGPNETGFGFTWRTLRWVLPSGTISCPVTLRGSFHRRTLIKTAGLLLGSITGATFGTCTGGTMTVLRNTLPWHVRYTSFRGTLPSITSMTLDILSFASEFDVGGTDCLIRTTTEEPLRLNVTVGAFGEIRTLAPESGTEIDLENEDFLCPLSGDMTFGETATIDGNVVEPITIRLVEVPRPAILTPTPREVEIEALSESGNFTLTNTGDGTATATITSVSDEGADEFDVTSPGCGSTIADGASCVYTISVNERPLAAGRVTITYRTGIGLEVETVSIPVDIQGDDPQLSATPSEVSIGAAEQNDTVVVRNTGDNTATITRVDVTTSDAEDPDLEAVSPGCRSTIAPGESCTYTITVNDRPETEGRVVISYRASIGREVTLTVPVDIGGEDPPPAELRATPEGVTIERLETNDSFVLRNVGAGTATAAITRIDVVADDAGTPEFGVTGPGCGLVVIDEASCTYIVTVNSRPEADGRVVFEYEDGIGGMRRTTVEVDIAS